MNQEEYKNVMKTRYGKLKYTISRNLMMSTLGLITSFLMLNYNTAILTDFQEQIKENKTLTTETFAETSLDCINKVQNIQNAAIGIGGASALYLILGLGIPLAGYIKNKKSLEKQL